MNLAAKPKLVFDRSSYLRPIRYFITFENMALNKKHMYIWSRDMGKNQDTNLLTRRYQLVQNEKVAK